MRDIAFRRPTCNPYEAREPFGRCAECGEELWWDALETPTGELICVNSSDELRAWVRSNISWSDIFELLESEMSKAEILAGIENRDYSEDFLSAAEEVAYEAIKDRLEEEEILIKNTYLSTPITETLLDFALNDEYWFLDRMKFKRR